MDNKGNTNHAVNPLGAAYYVVAVVLIYALSIVMLIASRVRRKHAKILEDRQIHKYLQEFQTVREKSHRDTYRNLKRMVIAQLGPNRVPKTAYCNLGQAIMPAVAVAMPSSTEVQRLAGAHRFSIISGGPGAGGGVEGADGGGEIPGEGDADSDESSAVFVDDSPVSIFFPDVNAMLHHERRESMRSRRRHRDDDCSDCDCDVSYDETYASSISDADDGREADGSKASMTSRNSRAGDSGSSARRYGSQYTRQEGRESSSNNERRRRRSFAEVLVHKDSSGDVHASGNAKKVSTHHSHHHSHHHHHSHQHGARVEVAAVSRLKRDAYAESYQHLVYHSPVAASSLSPARRAQSMHANGRIPPHLRGQSSVSSDNFTSHSETPSRTRKQQQQQQPSGTPSKVAVGRRHTAPYGRRKKSSRHHHQPRAERQTYDDIDYADDGSSHANEVDVSYTQTTATLHNDHERVVDDKTAVAVAASAVNPVCDEDGQHNSITLSRSPVTTITLPHQQFFQQQQKSRSRIQSDIVTDATHTPSPRPITRQSLPTPSADAAGLLKVPLMAFGDSGGGRKKLQLATVLPMPPQSPRRPASLTFEMSTAAAHSTDKRQCSSASSLPTTVIVSQPTPMGTPGLGQGQDCNEAMPL